MQKYNIGIPLDINSILDEDFFIIENIQASFVQAWKKPVKFSAFASIYIKRGCCDVNINLRSYHLEAPCVLNVKIGQILQKEQVSDDLEVSCIVLSPSLLESVVMVLRSAGTYAVGEDTDILPINEEGMETFDAVFRYIRTLSRHHKTEYGRYALLHAITGFFYHYAAQLENIRGKSRNVTKGRISDIFLGLVQQHFRQERFLDFYASKMSITGKHLSRTVKQQTGYTAVEWIEKFVILEAQALLKSSNMTIQQIASCLNFQSQSFFGKYFRKHTGMSPKEYRNSI